MSLMLAVLYFNVDVFCRNSIIDKNTKIGKNVVIANKDVRVASIHTEILRQTNQFIAYLCVCT